MAAVKGPDAGVVDLAAAPGAAPPLTRKERARRTRLRMVRAAQEIFAERGYTGAKMADIAAAAGVAVQTLYFTFHTKAELLQACYELAVLGEDDPCPPTAQPWHAAMLAAGSGLAALRYFADGNTSIVSRVGPLDDVVRSAAHEEEALAVRAHNEDLRRQGYRAVVEHLGARFGLRPGLSVERATDLLMAFGGAGMYRSLVTDYGWTRDEYAEWLSGALVQQLLADAATR
jgi:AcrR family transcriptional regulator